MRIPESVTVFILIIAGTAGLLMNEFICDCGSAAVILFAVLNVAGLVLLYLTRKDAGG
jgi:hypothetical protein